MWQSNANPMRIFAGMTFNVLVNVTNKSHKHLTQFTKSKKTSLLYCFSDKKRI